MIETKIKDMKKQKINKIRKVIEIEKKNMIKIEKRKEKKIEVEIERRVQRKRKRKKMKRKIKRSKYIIFIVKHLEDQDQLQNHLKKEKIKKIEIIKIKIHNIQQQHNHKY